jgi:long-chain-fatty-acid--[acyl-carrier-protein] ligase
VAGDRQKVPAVIDPLLGFGVKALLSLRYRVRLVGLNAVAARGRRGILFLPNHPALIDPVTLLAYLHPRFAPRVLVDRDQIDRPVIRGLARRIRAASIPDVEQYGRAGRREVRRQVRRITDDLRAGRNVLLYPSGRLYRSRWEDLGAARAAHRIVQQVPAARVVLVRTEGLWGSGFSWASGHAPRVAAVLKRGAVSLLANALVLSPRRAVTIAFHEPADLPRRADRAEFNRFLEAFYNRRAPPNTYVPYTLWEPGRTRALPEPPAPGGRSDAADVPQATRRAVQAFLADAAGRDVQPGDRLAHDLGLDSMAIAEVVVWLGERFGAGDVDAAALRTVGDVMRAAAAEAPGGPAAGVGPPPRGWLAPRAASRLRPPEGVTVTEAFLNAARRTPRKIIVADEARGPLRYRDVLAAVCALRRPIERLPGEGVGLMLPASAATGAVYLAALVAGKVPVMVNWTAGSRHLRDGLDLARAPRVLTSRRLASRIRSQGIDLAGVADRLVYLEDVRARLSWCARLSAGAAARLGAGRLRRATVPPTAAVLFTSGSETAPKAVALSHGNVLSNLRDVLTVLHLNAGDRLLAFLPPFHAFGLTVTTLLPLLAGLPAVYHPNPTAAAALAALAEAYRTTLAVGTPTFLGGMARAARGGALSSLRLIVTGAERCCARTYDALRQACPGAKVVEGYGVTECSPVVSVDDDRHPRRGSIGKVLPSFDHAIVAGEPLRRVRPGQTGMLLLSGPAVFDGYLNPDAPRPFVRFEGRTWYRTGDLVSEGPDGRLTFKGRRGRFVKIGGEMVSLPMIESILAERYGPADAEAVLAVEAVGDERRRHLVLCTPLAVGAAEANACLREAGLSPLYRIRRVERVEALPLLGTGKVDHRRLRQWLVGEQAEG